MKRTNPKTSDGRDRIVRGASWYSNYGISRSAYRYKGKPQTLFTDSGFRPVLKHEKNKS